MDGDNEGLSTDSLDPETGDVFRYLPNGTFQPIRNFASCMGGGGDSDIYITYSASEPNDAPTSSRQLCWA